VIVVEAVGGWKDVGGIVVVVEVGAVGFVDVKVVVDNVVVVVGDVDVVIWFFCVEWWC